VKILLFIFFASLFVLGGAETSAEQLSRLKKEVAQKQQEIDRLTALLTARENELRKLRIWMSNLSADGKMLQVSDREQRLLTGLKVLSDTSGAMVLKTMELAEQLRPKLNQLPLSSADRVRLVMALEDLERSAAKVNSITDTVNTKEDLLLKNVRVIAIKYELGMVVISAGALHGVFPGMNFVSADGKVVLRVLDTRSMISGALPVSGTLNDLVPGSRVSLQITRVPREKKGYK
jgi:hypothetical protein